MELLLQETLTPRHSVSYTKTPTNCEATPVLSMPTWSHYKMPLEDQVAPKLWQTPTSYGPW